MRHEHYHEAGIENFTGGASNSALAADAAEEKHVELEGKEAQPSRSENFKLQQNLTRLQKGFLSVPSVRSTKKRRRNNRDGVFNVAVVKWSGKNGVWDSSRWRKQKGTNQELKERVAIFYQTAHARKQ